MQKNLNWLTFRGARGLWCTVVQGAYSNHELILFQANLTHLNGHARGSGHHKINLYNEIEHFSRKNHKIWSAEAEIMVICQTKELELSSPKVFYEFFIIFTLIFYAWTILVIIVSINTYESMILATKIIKIGQLRLKL